MNKEVQIVISAKDAASRAFRGVSNTIQGFSRKAKSQVDRISRSVNQIGTNAEALAMPFSIAVGAMAASGDKFVDIAFKAETGAKLFNNMLERVGENQTQVAQQIEDLAESLRLPEEIIQQNAKDLLRIGYDFTQISDIYEGAVASGLMYGRDTVGSINSVTEALVSQMSVQLNRIGIAENLSTGYRKYAKELGKTTEELTDAERAAAAHLMIQEATESEVEDLQELFKGYGGSVANLGKEWYDTKVILGNQLMPIWTQFKQGVAELLNNFNNLDEKQKDIIWGIGEVAVKATAAAAGIGLIASAASLASKAFGILSGIATLVTNPMLLWAGGIAAVGVAAYTAWDQNWLGIKDKIATFVDVSIQKWEEFKSWEGWETLQEYGRNLANWLGDLWDNISTGDWEAAWTQVTEGLQSSWETLSSWEGWSKIWTWVVDATEVTWDFLKDSWNSLSSWSGWDSISSWIREAIKSIDWSKAIKGIRNAGQIALGVTFASKSIGAFAKSIASKLATQAGFIAATGTGSLALMTLGLKIGEEIAAGDDFMDDILNALGGAALGFALGGPWGAGIGMTIAVEFEVFSNSAKKVYEALKPIREMLGTETNQSYIDVMTGRNEPSYTPGTSLEPSPKWYEGTVFEGFFDWWNSQPEGSYSERSGQMSIPKNAQGGKIRGPGTGKSDSILSWVSNGEYIVNAEATSKWLPLLEAINGGKIPAFAPGGLVPGLTGNFDTDFSNVSGFINEMGKNLNKMVSVVVRSITASFEFIGKLIVDIAQKIFGEEKVNSALQIFEDFKQTIQDIFDFDYSGGSGGDGGKDGSGGEAENREEEPEPSWWSSAMSGIGNSFKSAIQNMPIAQGFMSGFADGGLAGGFVSLIENSKVFANIMEMINPILQQLANIAGSVLLPALKILEGPLKLVTKTLEWVAKTIIKVWNGIVDVLDRIIFWDSLQHWKASMSDLTTTTENLNKEMSEARRNMPSGFKIITARYQATNVGDSGSTYEDNTTININGPVYNEKELESRMKRILDEHRKKTGTAAMGIPHRGQILS